MEASKNDRLVKKFAALEDKTWFPQELLELVKDVCRLQSEVRASLAVSVDPALVCGDMEHRPLPDLLILGQFLFQLLNFTVHIRKNLGNGLLFIK